MLTSTDIATFDPRYRRFRAELRHATRIDKIQLALWIQARSDVLVRAFMAIVEENDTLVEFEAWERWQYQQARGRVS